MIFISRKHYFFTLNSILAKKFTLLDLWAQSKGSFIKHVLLQMGSEFIPYTYVFVNRIDIKAQNVGPFIINVNTKNLRPQNLWGPKLIGAPTLTKNAINENNLFYKKGVLGPCKALKNILGPNINFVHENISIWYKFTTHLQ